MCEFFLRSSRKQIALEISGSGDFNSSLEFDNYPEYYDFLKKVYKLFAEEFPRQIKRKKEKLTEVNNELHNEIIQYNNLTGSHFEVHEF